MHLLYLNQRLDPTQVVQAHAGDAAAAVWGIQAALHGVLGLAWGFVLIPVGEKVITPIWRGATSMFST